MTASTNTAQTTDSGRAAIRKLALNTFLGEGVVAACIDLAKSLVDGFDLDPLFIRDTQACLDPTDLDDPCCHPERLFFECCAPRSFIRSISVPRTFVADTTLSDTCVRASGDVDAVQRAVRQVLAKFQASFEHGVCDAQSAVTECTEPSLLSVVDVCEAQVYGSDGRGPRCLYVPSCVRCCSVFPVLFITPLPSPPLPFVRRFQGDCAAGQCSSETGRCLIPPQRALRLFFNCVVENINGELWEHMLFSLGVDVRTPPSALFDLFVAEFVEPTCVGPSASQFRAGTQLQLVDTSCEDGTSLCARREVTIVPTKAQCEGEVQCNWRNCPSSASVGECVDLCVDPVRSRSGCYQ